MNDDLIGQQVLREAFESNVPVIALLGQAAGYERSVPDPVLAEAFAKLNRQGSGWRSLLSQERIPDDFYPWLGERFFSYPPTAELLAIARAQFSAIYTSSIDPRLGNLFETDGREPDLVLLGDPPPAIKRSRRRPPLYSLFGRASLGVPDFLPPGSLSALAQRRMLHASPMLRTISETATALGLVVIDGFLPEDDWLRAEDLLAVIGHAAPGSVLWCGEDPVLSKDDQIVFDHLVETGTIVRDRQSLGQILGLLQTVHEEIFEGHWDEPDVISFASGKKLITSPSLRLATEASATIIDDSITGFLVPFSVTELQSQFRNFHAVSTGARALIAGIRRGFAIKRDFEEKLESFVIRAIERHHEESGAIILHGQSGVGKSIALGRLAVRLREDKLAAVLFASNSVPQATDIGDFLAEADSAEAVTVLLIDASASPERYDDLLSALRSRGHRAVVVGTSYRQDRVQDSLKTRFVEATAELSVREQRDLQQLSVHFLGEESAPATTERYALAGFFYRLPASRGRISEGLGREARFVGRSIAQKGARKAPIKEIGALGRALVDAGFPQPESSALDDSSDASNSDASESAANRLIDYVMVAARLYLWVPINLILRAAGATQLRAQGSVDMELVRQLFEGQDLFRWRLEDEEGQELLVGARLQLEAELICNRRLGGPVGEARRLVELVGSAVRAGSDVSSETRFLADLVYAIGPDGPLGQRYSESYALVAEALTRLRKLNGVENARLMLQEATLRRHFVRLRHPAAPEKAALLDGARAAVDDALQALERTDGYRFYASRRTVDNLWVERAATYGFIATDAAEAGAKSSEVWRNYLAARSAARMASGRVDTYFPLDIALWLPARILSRGVNLSDEMKVELQADIRSTLDLVEPESLDPRQFEVFQRQRASCASAINDTELAVDAYQALAVSGSTAGYYLQARSMAPDKPESEGELSSREIAKAAKAASYLWSHYDQVAGDTRCLQLLLSCEWLISTRRWLFLGNRQPLPWNTEHRQKIRRILADLNSSSPNEIQSRYRYLDAVFCWVLDDEKSAMIKFRDLASDTEYVEGGRVVARHQLSDENGAPQVFDGEVVRKVGERRWSLYIRAIHRHVDMIESDFRSFELKPGRAIRRFTVNFNYLGPLAKPAGARQ
jgi:hypothetical protein